MQRLLSLSFLLLISNVLYAEKLPKLEVGVAAAGQYIADYRGSNEYQTNALPFPIINYRGERIRIDRSGIKGEVLREKFWEINVSGEASLNGGTDDNSLREGMPDLDSAFEFGPSLNFALDGDIKDDGWLLRFPIRAVVTASEDGFEYIGYLFNPKLTYLYERGHDQWRSSTSVGAFWASEKFHDYYYQVDEAFVREGRPFYDAEAGFSGAFIKTSLSKRTGKWRYGVSVRYDNINNASFDDSPLVETNHHFSVSFFLAHYFWKSNL